MKALKPKQLKGVPLDQRCWQVEVRCSTHTYYALFPSKELADKYYNRINK